MYIRIKKGIVKDVLRKTGKISIVIVEYEGETHEAINYNLITGDIDKEDVVYINTSAEYLKLGSGGYDFIIINETKGENIDIHNDGRIMKMKYTPYQIKCFNPSDDKSFYHKRIKKFINLGGTIVITGELHSMLSPTACSIKYLNKDLKIVYIMTDAGCLPIDFSITVGELKNKGIIEHTITSGNAFGGDFEAINIFDALVIAKSLINPDIIIVTMGPGITGTGTRYGFTGIEQGNIINSVSVLKGQSVCIPRISFSDTRKRHFGISHHTLTVLSEIARDRTNVAVPLMDQNKISYINSQIKKYNLQTKHNVMYIEGSVAIHALNHFQVNVTTMGRSLNDDIEFFLSCGSAASLSLRMLNAR